MSERPDAAPLKERCENCSIPGVVAGQQCGLEKDHHGPCFYTGEFSVEEMMPSDAAPLKEVHDDECPDTMQLEAQCTLPSRHIGDHDYETPREVAPPPSDAAPPKEPCHHGISPVNPCSYCELELCGRPLRSGRNCKRSVFHGGPCFAPWPTTGVAHPSDCHCWECDERMTEDAESPPPSDAAPVITDEDLRSIWDAQFNVGLGGKQQEAIKAAIAAVVARHRALYAPSDAAQPTACVDCGRHYGNEYGFPDLVLPNEVWAAISPRGDGGGMLCPSCICKRLADRGFEDVPAVFRSGPCCVLAHHDTAPWISQYFRCQLERALVLIRRNVLPADLPNAESRLREAIRFLDTHPEGIGHVRTPQHLHH